MSRFLKSTCKICMNSVYRSYEQQQRMGVSLFSSMRKVINPSETRGLHLSSATRGSVGEGYHKPSEFDKKILVWTKKYSDVSEVPPQVTNTQMKKAKDLFRIRVNLMMVAATVVLAGLFAWSGRRAAKRGDSVVKQNRLWHAEGVTNE